MEFSDNRHLLEIEVDSGGVGVRFSICHEDSIDPFLVSFVLSAAQCVAGVVHIAEDLPEDVNGEFEGTFDGFIPAYMRGSRQETCVGNELQRAPEWAALWTSVGGICPVEAQAGMTARHVTEGTPARNQGDGRFG